MKTIECKTAREFIDTLRPSNPLWTGPIDSWIFRGQANANWGLVPSVLRQEKRPSLHCVASIEYELDILKNFIRIADEAGLKIPGDCYGFRKLDYLNNHLDPIYSKWPPVEYIEIFACVQHHGIPTRLLDFTKNSLIASFFASIDYMENQDSSGAISVWAVNRHYCNRYLGQFKVIEVPSHSNSFLEAQQGLFLFCEEFYGELKSTEKEFDLGILIEKYFSEIADHIRLHPKSITTFTQEALVKIVLPISESKSVLKYLYFEGIKPSTMMPDLNIVKQTMGFEKKLGIVTSPLQCYI